MVSRATLPVGDQLVRLRTGPDEGWDAGLGGSAFSVFELSFLYVVSSFLLLSLCGYVLFPVCASCI